MRSIKKSIARVFIIPPLLLLAHFIHCDAGGGFLGLQTFPYICMNGTADTSRAASVENTEKCTACTDTRVLADGRCLAAGTTTHPYVCDNGTPVSGRVTRPLDHNCVSCNS